MNHDDKLFYTCSLIEYLGRSTKNKRSDIVKLLGDDVKRIYNYSDVFHCEPIEKVADDFVNRRRIETGTFDNMGGTRYEVPSYWDIGRVFERLVEDVGGDEEKPDAIKQVFSSWIADKILNFNTDLYYQPRDYLAECYRVGEIIDA